jgi:xanthine/CO dehydrogenase XdhC/CoxF family maturation factor
MLIYRDGRCVGTIGGGCMEARVIQIARLMAAGEGEQARICHVDMTGNEAEEEGMVCGGEVDVFLEIV